MDSYLFIRIIVIAAVLAIAVMCLVFPLAARVGLAPAYRALQAGLWGFLIVAAGALGWAGTSGEWMRFSREEGFGELVQVLGFFGVFLFIVYFMGSRYLFDKLKKARAEEAAAQAAAARPEVAATAATDPASEEGAR